MSYFNSYTDMLLPSNTSAPQVASSRRGRSVETLQVSSGLPFGFKSVMAGGIAKGLELGSEVCLVGVHVAVRPIDIDRHGTLAFMALNDAGKFLFDHALSCAPRQNSPGKTAR